MRIGITGATGLIGRTFTQLAAANGHEIFAYTRGSREVAHATQTLTLPRGAPHQLPEIALDAMVHLAGESLMGLWTKRKKERIWASRVDLTDALMNHLQKNWQPANRPSVILAASGMGYYGSQGDSELTESSPRGEGFLASLCEKWEAAAVQAQDWGARVVHLRTSMVLADQGGAYPLMRRFFRYGLGGNLGTGRQWMSWIHLEDQVRLMLWALEKNSCQGALNLCAPSPELNRNFTPMLAAKLRRPALLHAPAFLLKLVLGKMAEEMLLCSQNGRPSKANDLGYRFAYPTLEDALASLN